MMEAKKQGVLLVNLGTPAAATPQAVKAFLSEFLHDHRVVDMTRWLWCPLLHGVILPIRSPKVAKLYQSVWMEQGSPLMVYSLRQKVLLEQALGLPVELGMTYGTPSLLAGIETLHQRGVEELLVLPLYPQYSATTTAAVSDGLLKALGKLTRVPQYHMVTDYFSHPLYIKALADRVRESWQQNGQGDYLLCSYHGIPQRYADNGDVYPQHCEETTRLLARELGVSDEQIGMSYQSRFGREPWLQPYTDETLKTLAQKGVKKLDIITPAFASDCLETLEEISVECHEIFTHSGGEKFQYIPCLNDSEAHIALLADIVKRQLPCCAGEAVAS